MTEETHFTIPFNINWGSHYEDKNSVCYVNAQGKALYILTDKVIC